MSKTLENVRDEYQIYISEKTDDYIKKIIDGDGAYHESTNNCEANGWDKKLHNAMPFISDELKKAGIGVKHSVKFGVTDWDMLCILR